MWGKRGIFYQFSLLFVISSLKVPQLLPCLLSLVEHNFLAQHGNWEDDHRTHPAHHDVYLSDFEFNPRFTARGSESFERAAIRIRTRRHRLSSSRYRFQHRCLCWIDASWDACSSTDRSTLAPITCQDLREQWYLGRDSLNWSLNDQTTDLILSFNCVVTRLRNPGYEFGEIFVYKLIVSHLRRPMWRNYHAKFTQQITRIPKRSSDLDTTLLVVTTLLLPVSERAAAVAVAIADVPAAEEDVIDEEWDEDDGWE